MVILSIIGISILLQLIAAVLALHLITVSGNRRAWILIAVAFFLMATRRLITFYQVFTGNQVQSSDLIEELITLFISAFMLAGIAWIGLVFRAIRSSEQALQQSEDRFRSLFENTAIGIYRTTPNGRILLANPALLRMLGYSSFEEISQRNLEGQGFESDYPHNEVLQRIERDGEVRGLESAWMRMDETIFFARESARAIRDKSGKILYYEGTLEDITEKKQAEKELHLKDELLNMTSDMAKVGGWEFDAVTLKGTWTDEVARIHDLDPDQETNVEMGLSFYSSVSRQKVENAIKEAIELAKPYDLELEMTSAKGQHKWVRTMGLPILEGDKVVRVRGIFQDITERKRVEDALKEGEMRYRALVEQAGDAFFVHDFDGRFHEVNQRACDSLGYTREELFQMKVTDIEQDFDLKSAQAKWKNIEPGVPFTLFGHQRRKDGTVFPVEVRFGCFEWASERLFLGLVRDITEREVTEETLRRRNEELARLYRASGPLISGFSLNLQEQAQKIVEVIQQEFGQDNCSLFVVQRDSNELLRLATAGPYADQVKNAKLSLDGEGLVIQAARTGETISVPNIRLDSHYISNWDAAQSELAIPFKIGNNVIGLIDMQSSEPNAFTPDDERLMNIFAERAALGLEHSRLNTQTEVRIQQLIALRTIDMAIGSSFDISLTLGVLLDQVIGQLGVHAVDILIFNGTSQTFRLASDRGFRNRKPSHTQLNLGMGYAWQAVRGRRMVSISNLQTESAGTRRSPNLLDEGFEAYLGVPLIAKGQIRGVLEIFQRGPLKFDADLYKFLELLAGQAAIAIDNFELFDNLQNSNFELNMAYDSTLEGWANALELRDHETGGHTRRSTNLTFRLAQVMGFKENDTVHIYRGALLHDIGKMGVPDSIVLKPGPLTADEWVVMRKHPQYAYDLLSPISYLKPAVDIPYCHHEKWDGTGYPRGLKGEQIPLPARIFAVVDVWDALTSDRPYRKAWTQGETITYIQEQAGRQFDPKVVEVVLKENLIL